MASSLPPNQDRTRHRCRHLKLSGSFRESRSPVERSRRFFSQSPPPSLRDRSLATPRPRLQPQRRPRPPKFHLGSCVTKSPSCRPPISPRGCGITGTTWVPPLKRSWCSTTASTESDWILSPDGRTTTPPGSRRHGTSTPSARAAGTRGGAGASTPRGSTTQIAPDTTTTGPNISPIGAGSTASPPALPL